MYKKTLMLMSVVGLIGCKSGGAQIETVNVLHPKANLTGYKDYVWAAGIGALRDKTDAWVPMGFDADAELRFLVNRELRSRGLSFAQEAPDAYAFYLVVVDMDAQEGKLNELYGEKIELDSAGEGALVVGLVDAQTEQPVWLGAAKTMVDVNRSDEEAMEILAAAVTKIFEGYKN